MLVVISPAKTLDFEFLNDNLPMSEARFLKKSSIIVEELRKLDSYAISKLMKLSDKLSKLNEERFNNWNTSLDGANHCLLAFKGEVYRSLDVGSFTEEEFFYANSHLRILSGLYGVLRPFDGIQPYRLEMGTKLKVNDEKDLYNFWGDTLIKSLIKELEKHNEKVIINLASNEYFKSVQGIEKENEIRVVTPIFKENKGGEYKIVTMKAKRARGLMTRYIIQNEIEKIEEIKSFNEEGYEFSSELSSENEWVFVRE